MCRVGRSGVKLGHGAWTGSGERGAGRRSGEGGATKRIPGESGGGGDEGEREERITLGSHP